MIVLRRYLVVIVELIGDCVFEFVPHDDIYYVIEQGIHEGTNMLRVNGSSIYLVDNHIKGDT